MWFSLTTLVLFPTTHIGSYFLSLLKIKLCTNIDFDCKLFNSRTFILVTIAQRDPFTQCQLLTMSLWVDMEYKKTNIFSFFLSPEHLSTTTTITKEIGKGRESHAQNG